MPLLCGTNGCQFPKLVQLIVCCVLRADLKLNCTIKIKCNYVYDRFVLTAVMWRSQCRLEEQCKDNKIISMIDTSVRESESAGWAASASQYARD